MLLAGSVTFRCTWWKWARSSSACGEFGPERVKTANTMSHFVSFMTFFQVGLVPPHSPRSREGTQKRAASPELLMGSANCQSTIDNRQWLLTLPSRGDYSEPGRKPK